MTNKRNKQLIKYVINLFRGSLQSADSNIFLKINTEKLNK
jgi:hypothetical protein